MTDENAGRFSTTRRKALIAAGSIVTVGAVGALDSGDEGGTLYGGTMALGKDYKLAESERTFYQGPDSAKSAITPEDGDRYEAVDTGVTYHGEGGSWTGPHSIGSSGTPIPELHTDELNNAVFARKSLAQDGSTDDGAALQSLIEDNEGGTIILEDIGVVNVDTQVAPDFGATDERTTILCWGNPTIDVSGVSGTNKLNFALAENVSLIGPVTIQGATGGGLEWNLRAGSGFRGHHLTLDGGQGGVNMLDASDVHLRDVTTTNQHDTTNGVAAGLRGKNLDNSSIIGFETDDTDRGIEIEEGCENVLVKEGLVNDPDSDGTASAPKSVEVTRHSTEADIKNITFENVTVQNHEAGPRAKNNGTGGVVEGIVFRDFHVKDGPAPFFDADDVTVERLEYDGANLTWAYGFRWLGGSLTVRDSAIRHKPTDNIINIQDLGAIPHDELEVKGLWSTGSGGGSGTDHGLYMAGGPDANKIHIEDWTLDGAVLLDLIHIESTSLSPTAGFGATFERVMGSDGNDATSAGDFVDMTTTGNAPIKVVDSKVSGAVNGIVVGSVFEGVDGITPSDVPDGVAVDDGGLEDLGTSPTSAPTASWPEGTEVRNSNADNDETWKLIGGTWVQTA